MSLFTIPELVERLWNMNLSDPTLGDGQVLCEASKALESAYRCLQGVSTCGTCGACRGAAEGVLSAEPQSAPPSDST